MAGRIAPSERGYRPQLDALRAVAVLCVLASHFWQGTALSGVLGAQGVRLFFVLSGFLITGILLDAREIVDDGQSVGATLRRFYARRALRLLPLAYATLAVFWLLGARPVRDSLLWHVAYLSNVYFTRIGDWPMPVTHLWTLAVEEQFYLVWPLVVLLAPRRALAPLVVSAIAAAPLFRALAPALGASDMAVWTLPFGVLDALGLGALLALSRRDGRWPRWLAVALAPSIALAAARYLPLASAPPVAWLLGAQLWQTALDVVFAAIVFGAARGWTGVVGRAASWGPLVQLGRISYGVYLLHLFVAYAVERVLVRFGHPLPWTGAPSFLGLSALTIAAAAASWRWFERPLNALKRHLPYRVARTPAGAATDAAESIVRAPAGS